MMPSPSSPAGSPAAWSLPLRERGKPPSPAWAIAELLLAVAILAAALAGYISFSADPWLLLVAALFVWWRGPGWRALGLRRSGPWFRVVAIGIVSGVGYQFVGLYAVEPLIARMTSGGLPDVSSFRPVVGNETGLAIYLTLSWTLAAFMEEMVYRGWIIARLAELGAFSRAAWVMGVVVSSALFGAAHLYQGISGVIATGLTGFVFACVYFAAGRNLWAAILAHGFLDTTGFLMIYFGVYPGL
jgi:membrane protease YdiL (CAAX protease family)